MIPRTFSRFLRTSACLGLICAAGASLTLTGCGKDDSNAQAIRQAKIDMDTLGATGPGKGVTYQKIADSLSGAANSSRAGEASAARLLRSRAFMRQGDDVAEQVSDLERQAAAKMSTIRAAHNHWLDLDAQAQAHVKYDPAPELQQLDDKIKSKGQDVDQAKAALAEVEGRIQSLQDQAAAALQKSRAQRDQELALRNQTTDKTQTQVAELVKAAIEAKRIGDGFDKEAADLNAVVGKERPAAEEIRMRIQRLSEQKNMLEASKQRLVEATATRAKYAERAREGYQNDKGDREGGAKQAGDQIVREVGELKEIRGQIGNPAEEASKLYKNAASEVGRGGGGGQMGGRGGNETGLAVAAAKHAEADLLMIRAAGLKAYADLMGALAQTKPPLPNAADCAKEANESVEAARTLLTEAQTAFGQAKDEYERAGGGKAATVKERLEDVAKTLAVFDNRKPVDVPADTGTETAATPPATETTPTATETPKPTPVALEGVQGEVQAMLVKFTDTMKKRDYEALKPMMMFRNAQQEANYSKLIPLYTKVDALDAACVAAFGRDFESIIDEWITQHSESGSHFGNSQAERILRRLKDLDPADVEITVAPEGNEAEIFSKSAKTQEPLSASKPAGEWRLHVDFEIEGAMSADGFMQAQMTVVDKITEKVKAGEYGSNSAKMIEDFLMETIKAVAETMKQKDPNK